MEKLIAGCIMLVLSPVFAILWFGSVLLKWMMAK